MTEGADSSGQPLMEHLTELRSRLVKTFIAVGVGTVVAFFFRNQMLHLLQSFLQRGWQGGTLVVTGPTDQFSIAMRMALFGGTCCWPVPVIAYHAWSFINPGLTQRERKWAFPGGDGAGHPVLPGGRVRLLEPPPGGRFPRFDLRGLGESLDSRALHPFRDPLPVCFLRHLVPVPGVSVTARPRPVW